MANANTTSASFSAIYLSPEECSANKATSGKLRWLGGNIGLDFPISIDVIDDQGRLFAMGMESMLSRLQDFEGERHGMTSANNLLANCFAAYEYKLMTSAERVAFESYVRETIGAMTQIEAARRIVLGEVAA